jgi:hypothetical protein
MGVIYDESGCGAGMGEDPASATCDMCGETGVYGPDAVPCPNGCTPPPESHLRGTEAAIRKAGQVAIDELVDGWSDTLVLPGSDDLADYLTRIVDACVRAALTTEGQP